MATATTSLNVSIAAAKISFLETTERLDGLAAGEICWSVAITTMTGEAFDRLIATLKSNATGTDGAVYSVWIAEFMLTLGKYAANELVGGDDLAGDSTTTALIDRARGQMTLLETVPVDGVTTIEYNKEFKLFAPSKKFKIAVINDDTAALTSTGNSIHIEGVKPQGVTP